MAFRGEGAHYGAVVPGSSPEGKVQAVEFARTIAPPATVLDIGPGMGTWHGLLAPHWQAEWTCIEIWAPYVDRYDLRDKYDRVIIEDAAFVSLAELHTLYDLAIFGDVIEHLSKPWAVEMVLRLPWRHALISVPIITYPQGAWEGNPYEAHKATWCTQDVIRAFPVTRHWAGEEIGVFLLERGAECST